MTAREVPAGEQAAPTAPTDAPEEAVPFSGRSGLDASSAPAGMTADEALERLEIAMTWVPFPNRPGARDALSVLEKALRERDLAEQENARLREALANSWPVVRAENKRLADALATRDPGRAGMVTVYNADGSYAGCMGTETWRWLLAHPEVDAPALVRAHEGFHGAALAAVSSPVGEQTGTTPQEEGR